MDAGLARGETALAILVLSSIIALASLQAIFRNLTHFELAWANRALAHLDWVDPFLQKGTLWLAFLGASLATREQRHIAIDVLPRLAPPRVRHAAHGISALGAAVVSFFLARAFLTAVLVQAAERPVAMEVFAGSEPIHVCDATARQLAAAGTDAPAVFCAVRPLLSAIAAAPIETVDAALQLIVPVMFVVIALRLAANGAAALLRLRAGQGAGAASAGDRWTR